MGRLSSLPNQLDAIIATADLEGREQFESATTEPPRLLGEVLPEQLASGVLPSLGIRPERTVVVLDGDFYTVPALDARGGSGDLRNICNEPTDYAEISPIEPSASGGGKIA